MYGNKYEGKEKWLGKCYRKIMCVFDDDKERNGESRKRMDSKLICVESWSFVGFLIGSLVGKR